MRFIDIDLDGLSVRAKLRDDVAPVTCAAIWDALPFAGTAAHALISGQGFRVLERIPVGELPLEGGTALRHPGQLSYYPPNEEIGFCVGESRFAAHRSTAITPFAEIEGDFEDWAQRGDDLQRTGTRPIRIARATDQETPFRYPTLPGPEIELDLGGVSIRAGLLDQVSPATVAVLEQALPLTAEATMSSWGGANVTRVWMPETFHEQLAEAATDGDRGTTFHWAAYVYVHREDGDLRICHGDGQEFAGGAHAVMTPVARICEDISAFAEQARTLRAEGAKTITIGVRQRV
jgi:hypothetical protein